MIESAKEYTTIACDPPWFEQGGGSAGAQNHYQLMKTDKIIELLQNLFKNQLRISDNAHLYLWVTVNFLEDGLRVAKSLGFRYIRPLIWIKGKLIQTGIGKILRLDQMGLGQYFRGSMEMCLFCVKGKLPTQTKNCRDIFFGHRREHSKKPEIFYEIVQQQSPGNYIEIFSRTKRKGWDNWGNEADNTQKELFI